MISLVKDKLDKIADIWQHLIWEYKFCNQQIKFTAEVKTNYFGDILGYFHDTFDIVFNDRDQTDFSSRFSNHISLLQAIYVQQDFIEEMLIIFKTGVEKGTLKKNPDYAINREIRNELIGHPIRRINGEFISSTTFGYEKDEGSIVYLRYHKDNDFKFEAVSCVISEIQQRHAAFLNTYFDIILERCKGILDEYLIEIGNLEAVIEKKDFSTVLKVVSLYFESILQSDYSYDSASLSQVFERRNRHARYANFIDMFYKDLKDGLVEIRSYIKQLFESKPIQTLSESLPKVEIVFVDARDNPDLINEATSKVTCHYELGKLATKRNPMDFQFFSGLLRSKCEGNEAVLVELDHMERFLYDDIEYYCALRLIEKYLGER